MRRALFSLCLSALLVSAAAPPARPYALQYTPASTAANPVVRRWQTRTINVVLSTSLQNPPASIKPGSDVEGAARRALRRWEEASGTLNFNVAVGATQLAVDDGVNVITVSAQNGNFGGEQTGRARIDFDPGTGFITEADVSINPNVRASDGSGGPGFSTDGTHDTYDLESVFVHEIGHMLGLEHSGVVGATMQPRQVRNFFGLKQPTPRTLSDDDIAGIRTLYPPQIAVVTTGTIQGSVNYGAGAHVFAENVASGRVQAGAITLANGSYRIEQLPPGDYRVVVEFLNEPVFDEEIATQSGQGPYAGIGQGGPFPAATALASVAAGQTSTVNFTVGGANIINLRRHGLLVGGAVIIHGGPMPLTPPTRVTPPPPGDTGGVYRYYVAGDNLDQIPAANYSFTTPFIVIDPASYRMETSSNFPGLNMQLVSFDIRVLDTAKVGDYSLRAQSTSGEVAYLAGALTVDPYTDRPELNPINSHDFFVRQQYRDFLSREPEPQGFQSWLNVLNGCPNAFNTDKSNAAAACDRITVSSAFFRSREFELKGRYIFNFYRAGLGRSPSYAEFVADMQFITGATEAEVNQRRDQFAANFAARAEFQPTAALPADQYVNTLMNRYGLQSIRTPNPASPNDTSEANKVTLTRADLVSRLNAGTLTRAQVLRAVADSDQVLAAEFNRSFVTMQYFGYLRRDPDPGGFNNWLAYLNANPTDFYTMVSGFLNSREYRTRFGQP